MTPAKIDAALETDPMREARAKIHAALASTDATAALRSLAIDLARQGLGQGGAEATFAAVGEELAKAGRDEDAKLVVYVLDMIADW